jgi:ParB-like chromosome segregation protein Spo0J
MDGILTYMEKTELKNVPIDKLIPYATNPRINDKAVDKVAASIKAHGYIKTSIGVDENMVLLFGHTTLKALKRLGAEYISEVTQVTGMPEALKISYRIADNKASEYASWDFPLLIDELEKLQDFGASLEPTGFGDWLDKSAPDIKDKAFDGEFESERTIGKTLIVCPECGHEFERTKMNYKKGSELFKNEH